MLLMLALYVTVPCLSQTRLLLSSSWSELVQLVFKNDSADIAGSVLL